MEQLRDTRARARRGFTLVELLVVMGIIGLLVSLLLPAVNHAVIVVRSAASANIIQGLGAGCQAFKADWGRFPPSNTKYEDFYDIKQDTGESKIYGFNYMAVALMGPNAKGWGSPEDGDGPYKRKVSGTFGPYFQQETGAAVNYVADAFKNPMRKVFYYRFDRQAAAAMSGLFGGYNFADAPSGSSDLGLGFRDAQHLLLSAAYKAPDNKYRWKREDFLLVSPGSDRLYGYVKQQGDLITAATTADMTTGTVFCDDIANFDCN